jgi:hypothetical protein
MSGQERTLPYPPVMSEIETLQAAISGRSIARLGDGELRLADGRDCISQVASKSLRGEMIRVLTGDHNTLVCIPHMASPKFEKTWNRYHMDKYVQYYTRPEYGSAFISRPDSAPWIDTDYYWDLCEQLWAGKDVVLVISEEHSSLRPGQLHSVRSLRVVEGPRRDAYEQIGILEAKIGILEEGATVVLCLGACATVLAVRLNTRFKAHALDLGHIGRMMRGRGRWRNEQA